MKKLISVMLVLLVLAGCKDKTKFVVKGKVEHPELGTRVFLYGFRNNQMAVLDSTVLSDKGEFVFEGRSPEGSLFRIHFGGKTFMITAANGEVIDFSTDFTDPKMSYEQKGSDDTEILTKLNQIKNGYSAKIEKIQAEFDQKVEAAPGNRDQIVQEMLPAYTRLFDAMNREILAFASDNARSIVGFYAISMVNPEHLENEMIAYADKVRGKFNNGAVRGFVARMDLLKKVQVGQTAPGFSIKAMDEKLINLSDFKGKYVLLDFWASWCQPCRQENPNLVKAYNLFKDRNFTILGISLDKDKAAWAGAIKADNLTWQHGSDLNDFNSKTAVLYQVEAIPASYILDPQGKILAKNLRGEALEAFLEKTLKN